MKKTTLKIQKFKIHSLENTINVKGGTGTTENDDQTNTGNTKLKTHGAKTCFPPSDIKIPTNAI